jgi:TPP-dependent pyruvate/acetoin dehydrogenase alpha subunit
LDISYQRLLAALIAGELWGKVTGCAGGKGGQMHLTDVSVGAYPSNAIVGANIPIATGAALAFRLAKTKRVAVSFFGDGATNIGAFHEGLNLAAVKNAPVVFVWRTTNTPHPRIFRFSSRGSLSAPSLTEYRIHG